MSSEIELIANDIVNWADDEQAEKGNDRETAISNILFEWQAYYGGDMPEYVERKENEVARKLIKEKVNDDLSDMSDHKVPAGTHNTYQIGVRHEELEDEIREELEAELAKRGEPV